MRKFIFALMASLLSSSALLAFWPEAAVSSLEVGVGYRQDKIEWTREISSGSGSYYSSESSRSADRLKSKIKWEDLNIWLIEARGRYITCDNVYLRGMIDYGWITSGKIKHSVDFNGEYNYFDDYFDHNKHHVKGNVWDGKLAVGYQFKWCDEALSFAPVVGYSWHGNELRNGDDDYYYSYGSDYSSSRSSYYSSYSDYSSYSSGGRHKIHQRWNGPFVGFDLDYLVCCDWNLFLGYEYHWADYHAKESHGNMLFQEVLFGNAGCIQDNSVSIHGKNGWGNVLNFGVRWDLCNCWTVALRGEFQWWEVEHAREKRKLTEFDCGSHVEVETLLKTRVKNVIWDSASVVLDFGMVF